MNEVVAVRMAGWAAMVKQRSEGGLTVKEWCAANDVSVNAYYYRLRQMRIEPLRHLRIPEDEESGVSAGVPEELQRDLPNRRLSGLSHHRR
jgi:hypothetical protein